MLRGTAVLAALLVCATGPAVAQVVPFLPVVKAADLSVDPATGEAVLRGNPSIDYGPTRLTADELRYNREKGLVTALGHFVITSGAERLLADHGTYRLSDGLLQLSDVLAGEPPFYLAAASATGTRARLTLHAATFTYHEPGPWAPSLLADQMIYEPHRRITGEHGHLELGDTHFLALPRFEQSFDRPFILEMTTRAGFRRNLGAYLDLGLHLPVWPGINLGADVGEYTARGVMAGPAGEYNLESTTGTISGSFTSGFINDHGDRKTDLLGRPVPADRAFAEWRHQQEVGDRLTLTGQVSWWKDSEVLRDFRPSQFFPVQQPDSFLEAAYAGDNYYLGAFARLDPNNFEVVQQRLPEIRFDLLPLPVGAGFFERFNASYAALREDPPAGGATLHSDRLDAYYALYRPLAPTDWLSLTPVAGGRMTYYAKATGGRDTYTRWLGEAGLDAEMRASGTFNYRNEVWGIDGLRHLLTPRLSYRYIPGADRGQPYIPSIDRTVFSTNLEPIDLGAIRNIDDLHPIHTLRLGLDNLLQTRDAQYGSRDLFAVNLAADYRIATPPGANPHRWSEVYTELSLTPVRWLRFELYQRLSPQTLALRELNTGLELIDLDWWTLRLATNYVQNQIAQYYLDYDRRLNDVWHGFTRVRYDARARRWNELSWGLRQRVANTWNLRYEVSWVKGQQRESSFGFSVGVDLVRF